MDIRQKSQSFRLCRIKEKSTTPVAVVYTSAVIRPAGALAYGAKISAMSGQV